MPESSTSTSSSEPINVITKYFVPPNSAQYSKWGLVFAVFIVLILMFGLILYIYVSLNYYDYYNRINVISNANWFGKNPQIEFQKYIANTQADVISNAMNNIKTSNDNIVNSANRINDRSSRLSKQVLTDVVSQSKDANTLGSMMRTQIDKLVNSVNNMISNVYVKSTTRGPSVNVIVSPANNSSVSSPVSTMIPSPAPAPASNMMSSPAPTPAPTIRSILVPAPASTMRPSPAPTPASTIRSILVPAPASTMRPSPAPAPSPMWTYSPNILCL